MSTIANFFGEENCEKGISTMKENCLTLSLRKLSALIAGPCCGESRLLNINLCEYGNNFMACAGSSYIVFALGLH